MWQLQYNWQQGVVMFVLGFHVFSTILIISLLSDRAMYLRDKQLRYNASQKLSSGSLKMNKIKTSIYIFLNTFSSITIILINKWIYTHNIFPNVSLTMIHFVTTFLGLFICEKFNFFNVKSANLSQLLTLALCFCGFVVFTNLSLQYNTVGAFQVAKVLTTPMVMVIQSLFKGKHFPLIIKLTTIPVIIGVTMCFVYDIRFNVMGTVFAALGVIITSLYQVLVNSKQSEMQLDSMQLLYYQAPLSAFILCLCIPFIEPEIVLSFSRHWSITDVVFVVWSCLMSVMVNLTTYWILGNTSPLTYNMVGHTKFVLVTLGGWYIFDHEMLLNQWFGILLTLFGLILYTHLKLREQKLKEQLINEEEK